MEKLIINSNEYDFNDILISSLRYSLHRKTYMTSFTSEYIRKNIDLLSERAKIVMLRDLEGYKKDRVIPTGTTDDECDYQVWLALENVLLKSKNNVKNELKENL